jgi:hypothetical protein
MLGAKDLDKKGLSYWDGINFGKIIWDKEHDLSSEDN